MEFIDLAQLTDIADIGFVLLVVGACMRALIGSGQASVQDDPARYEELKHIEAMLRELVAEAGAASSNLDRQLLTRKRDLEVLLEKLEAVEHRVSQPASVPQSTVPPVNAGNQRQSAALAAQDDLPNASWTEAEKPEEEQSFELEALLSDTADTVSFSGEQVASDALASLADQIEISEAANQEEGQRGLSDLDGQSLLAQLDPIAVKVARRLVADGQEIHQIARKLDLPIAQVRVLDRLLRGELPDGPGGVVEPLQRSANAF